MRSLGNGLLRSPEELALILRRRLSSGKCFYGAYCFDVGMQLDEFVYSRYFAHNHFGVCLECGALDGVTTSNTLFFEKSLGWKCYHIEPTPASFCQLISNRHESYNYNVALSDRDGKLQFCCSRLAGLNSVSKSGGDILEVINVEAITYKTFIERTGITKLDLFILDVERHEVQVVTGMSGTDVFPSVFVIECQKESFFEEVYTRLEKFDYVFDVCIGGNYIFTRDASPCQKRRR